MNLLRPRPAVPRGLPFLLACALGLLCGAPRRALAQDEPHLRVGLSLGGTALVALVLERVDDHLGLELTLGTWSFRDLSASAAVRGYLGASALRPVVGAGLWLVAAPPGDAARAGLALVARFPIGFDWRVAPDHFVDLDFNVNRALLVRRRDVEEVPTNGRLIPIPGLSYRWAP